MANRNPSRSAAVDAGRERALGIYRSHRVRKVLLILLVLLALFALLGFFLAPSLIKKQLETQLGAQLDRPVTVGDIHFNPFTLRLALDKLHIGERDGKTAFVDVDNLVMDASWTSLFRMAPILDQLSVQHPQIHIMRTGPQTFNFTDIVQKFASKPSDPNAPPSRFALSNISVNGGDITVDDKVQNTTHHVGQIQIGVPFIANLSHDTDIFVQPLLAMQVDGSPIRIEGQTKPFADSHESVMHFKLDHFDLPRYLGYVPTPLPAAISRGQLSGAIDLHFIETKPTQQLKVEGALQVDDFAMTTHDNVPMLELGHAGAALDDIEPLLSRYHFGAMALDQLHLHYTKQAGNRTNFDALTGGGKTPPKPGTPATDAHIAALTLQNSSLEYADLSSGKAARISLDNVHGSIRGMSTVSTQPAAIDLTAGLAGGNLHVGGNLLMSHSQFKGDIGLQGVSLLPLVAMVPPMLNAQIASGSLDGDAHVAADWSKTLALTMDTSKLTLNNVALDQRGRKPIMWQSLSAEINHLDLGNSQAQLGNVVLQGFKVDAHRLRDGKIDLSDLAKSSPRRGGGKQATTPAWHWSVAHLEVDGSAFALTDATLPAKAGRITLTADKFGIDNLSDNMHQPIKLDLIGGVGHGGKFHITGNVKPQPADADLRIAATRLDVAPFESLVKVPLNVYVESAQLSARGHLRYHDHKPEPLVSYQGQLGLSRVHVLDKVTNDDFLRWNTMSATGLNVRMGEGPMHVNVGGLSLSDFYARVIVNSNGRLNLQDVVGNQAEAPVSVTRAQGNGVPLGAAPAKSASAAAAPAPAPVPTPAPAKEAGYAAAATSTGAAVAVAPASTAAAPPADIHIGGVVLAGGNLNYTDNFIKPNYTANITQLAGKIGAFGTSGGGAPADLTLQGQLDDNAPVDISGTMNPLTPVASLDIKGKADGVELTHLSPYSGKYAGYPIIKGRLTMDVHYMLDQGKLNADNHIFLNQLTFGDRIDGPGISHLPVKLAVALLKDSQGNIDIDVPVTGSLNDPHFSLGGVIWHAFVNLITRAVTAPFRLLASAMGGGKQDLGYVEFAPGSNALDKDAQARLTSIAKILNEKPSLKLDITGRVDPSVDEKGLRTVLVDDMVQKEQADDIGSDAAKAAPVKPGTDDYNKYLEKAYKHDKIKKPRDLVGLHKSEPPDQMLSLMETAVVVDQDALRHLGERRADVVRQFLHGKVDDNRVFVLAPKLDAKGIDDKGKTTRDDFGLH